jgi:hypothetical protein
MLLRTQAVEALERSVGIEPRLLVGSQTLSRIKLHLAFARPLGIEPSSPGLESGIMPH